MPHTLVKNGDVLEVSLQGRWSDINDAADKIRPIAGRQWIRERKVWLVEATPANADRLLKSIRPEADDELIAWVRESMTDYEDSLTAAIADDAQLLVPWGHQRMPWQPEVINDEKFNGALPWQRAAIEKMAVEGRALLCDDMGLGKTFESITAVEEHVLRNPLPDGRFLVGPKLVIAPASALGSWERELNRFIEEPRIQIVDGSAPKTRHDQLVAGILDDAWVIVNWEQLRIKKLEVRTNKGGKKKLVVMKEPLFEWPQCAEWGLDIDDWDAQAYGKAQREFGKADPYWLAVIADEIHRAKNREALQSKGLHRTHGLVEYGLTGTPIMNSPDELWSPLRWLWPDQYHERGQAHSPGAVAYWPFYEMHVDYWEDQRGNKVVTGVKNPDGLRFALKDKLIRRTASILGLKGRKRLYYDVKMTPKQEKVYREAEKDMWLEIERDAEAGDEAAGRLLKMADDGTSTVSDMLRIPNGAARFVRCQQVLENAKLLGGDDESGSMDDFEEKYLNGDGSPWMVWCLYKESCEILADRMRKHGAKVAIFNGDVKSSDRTEIVNEFQRGEIDVLVGTIAAMYQSITLTYGHLQHWLSRSVVPAWNEQGEARQDRLGQQELVRVLIPQYPNTVATNKVHPLNRLKEGIVKTVVSQDTIEEEGLING